ncbi:hypothetical protein GCM10010515_60780 [Streptomyces fructofermentans]|uniref:Uncharacterized protein n=1 Tax=Streptomyces fructofermentans TaxID=152141 RepID=A0A918NPG8_9ACTN|nr:hypothetical protein GCM10010515_60780 [Streptomyces fructofermentans]
MSTGKGSRLRAHRLPIDSDCFLSATISRRTPSLQVPRSSDGRRPARGGARPRRFPAAHTPDHRRYPCAVTPRTSGGCPVSRVPCTRRRKPDETAEAGGRNAWHAAFGAPGGPEIDNNGSPDGKPLRRSER